MTTHKKIIILFIQVHIKIFIQTILNRENQISRNVQPPKKHIIKKNKRCKEMKCNATP